MPMYEYECQSCGDGFETVQGYHDGPLKKCKKCNAFQLIRIIQPSHISTGPKTLGMLAEANAKGMSNEHKDKMAEEYKTKKTINRIEGRGPETVEQAPLPNVPEWIEKPRTKTKKDISKMTKKQREKYIRTGK